MRSSKGSSTLMPTRGGEYLQRPKEVTPRLDSTRLGRRLARVGRIERFVVVGELVLVEGHGRPRPAEGILPHRAQEAHDRPRRRVVGRPAIVGRTPAVRRSRPRGHEQREADLRLRVPAPRHRQGFHEPLLADAPLVVAQSLPDRVREPPRQVRRRLAQKVLRERFFRQGACTTRPTHPKRTAPHPGGSPALDAAFRRTPGRRGSESTNRLPRRALRRGRTKAVCRGCHAPRVNGRTRNRLGTRTEAFPDQLFILLRDDAVVTEFTRHRSHSRLDAQHKNSTTTPQCHAHVARRDDGPAPEAPRHTKLGHPSNPVGRALSKASLLH